MNPVESNQRCLSWTRGPHRPCKSPNKVPFCSRNLSKPPAAQSNCSFPSSAEKGLLRGVPQENSVKSRWIPIQQMIRELVKRIIPTRLEHSSSQQSLLNTWHNYIPILSTSMYTSSSQLLSPFSRPIPLLGSLGKTSINFRKPKVRGKSFSRLVHSSASRCFAPLRAKSPAFTVAVGKGVWPSDPPDSFGPPCSFA